MRAYGWPPVRAAAVLLIALGTLTALPGREIQSPPARTVVLIGVDGADWLAIDPLIRAGTLPTFARFRTLGRTGVMLATPPLVSPMIWTTIATGVEPENHGILDFVADLPDGRETPIGSSQRLAPALWNLFSDAGRRVAVVGWWATWPAEHVNGTIVSDAIAPQLTRTMGRPDSDAIWPASKAADVLSRVVPMESVSSRDLEAYIPASAGKPAGSARTEASRPGAFYNDPVSHLAAVVAGTRTYTAIAQQIVRSDRPDFLALYLESVDTLSHLFVKAAGGEAKAIERAYQDVDAIVRTLAEASAPESLVIVCSDHGFYPPTADITANPSDLAGPATAWHRPYGIVAVATAGALASGRPDAAFAGPASLGIVTPLDIAPTILHAAALPVAEDMPGRVVREMLPADAARAEVRRSPPRPYVPPRMPAPRADTEEALARLQALGYIGAARTSLGRRNLGESLLRRGKVEAAERELRAVLEQQPANLSANLWLAQALVRQGRAPAALGVYERAVGLPGGAREALVAAVELALDSGDAAAARRLLRAGEKHEDAKAAAHVARGAIAEHQRDIRRAEASYRAAIEVDPALFDASARLVDLLIRAGRVREALDAAAGAVRAAPDSARHLALAGEASLAAGDAVKSENALRRALELAPDAGDVRIALGRALVTQHKFDAAIDTVSPAPPSADREVVLGAAYSGQRDFARALTHLQAALDRGRGSPEVLNGIGFAFMQLGRKADAVAMFERSLSVKADQPRIRRMLQELRQRE